MFDFFSHPYSSYRTIRMPRRPSPLRTILRPTTPTAACTNARNLLNLSADIMTASVRCTARAANPPAASSQYTLCYRQLSPAYAETDHMSVVVIAHAPCADPRWPAARNDRGGHDPPAGYAASHTTRAGAVPRAQSRRA